MVLKITKSFLPWTASILGSIAVATSVWSGVPNTPADLPLTIKTISNPAAPGSIAPNLTKAPAGRVILSWLEPSGPALVLKFAIRDRNSWGPAQSVIARQDFDRYAEAPPWVTMLADGALIAIWAEELPSGGKWPGNYLYTAASHDGGKRWSQPRVIHSDRSKSEHSFASVAPINAHSELVVWLDARDYETQHRYRLMSAEVDSTGLERNEQTIDDDVCTCCPTSLTQVGPDLLAAYRNHTSDDIRDIGIAREHDGAWSRPEIVHNDGWRINACPVNGPALTGDGDSVIAAWYTAANGSPTLNLAFSKDRAKSFLPPSPVDKSSGNAKPVGRPALTPLSNHQVLLTWIRQLDGPAELLAAVRDINGQRAKPSIVARGNARSLGYPRVQTLADGAIVSWGGAGDEKIVRTAFVPAF